MRISIVTDLGFGDAGKGVAVDFLACQEPEKSLVIRHSGGHQVGHTVKVDDFMHTFSNFGAGSLRGVPTYYTPNTTVFPPALLAEYDRVKRYCPKVFWNPLVLVTTPMDIAYNRCRERRLGHGSCGVGFAATVERNLAGICLFAKDLEFEWILAQKLSAIDSYYRQLVAGSELEDDYKRESHKIYSEKFIEACQSAKAIYDVADFSDLRDRYSHLIFEGSQGILLDQKHGIFPHVTRSNTTSQNAIEMIRERGLTDATIDIFYVTRCYQTRHGNGPMSNECLVGLCNAEGEANQENEYQGQFRVGELDGELLNYALKTDDAYLKDITVNKNILISCLDQRPDFDMTNVLAALQIRFHSVYGNDSADSRSVRRIDALT